MADRPVFLYDADAEELKRQIDAEAEMMKVALEAAPTDGGR
jgi:hypothetical protein